MPHPGGQSSHGIRAILLTSNEKRHLRNITPPVEYRYPPSDYVSQSEDIQRQMLSARVTIFRNQASAKGKRSLNPHAVTQMGILHWTGATRSAMGNTAGRACSNETSPIVLSSIEITHWRNTVTGRGYGTDSQLSGHCLRRPLRLNPQLFDFASQSRERKTQDSGRLALIVPGHPEHPLYVVLNNSFQCQHLRS
jgi:hypothetical protein